MTYAMNVIVDNLYLGSVEAAYDIKALEECGITHILTVDIRPLWQDTPDKYVSKYIHGLDLDDTDLLTHFDECNQFIEEGRTKGGVLVHCHVGSSRSATLVLAYLMNKSKLSFKDAFDIVKTVRPVVKPNYGFRQQLLLYEAMGGRLDQQSNIYRQYKLNRLSMSVQAGVYEGHLPDNVLNNPLDDSKVLSCYKCRKCRQVLFKSTILLSHMAGKGESAFDWRCKLGTEEKGEEVKEEVPCVQSLFIEPLKWMSSYIHNMDGKIACPKCSAKIGSFIWYGERCPCGTWVAPAFHIQSAKVDLCKPVNIVKVVNPINDAHPSDLEMLDNPGPSDVLDDT